jgi:hypothetical protein
MNSQVAVVSVLVASGTQFTSPQKTVLWLDNIHAWQVITGGNINLHYYDGGASFGQALHDAAVDVEFGALLDQLI